jgi:hypothetical protein
MILCPIGWINQTSIADQWRWWTSRARPTAPARSRPAGRALTTDDERDRSRARTFATVSALLKPYRRVRTAARATRVSSVVQAPTVRRIIAGANQTAPGATLIAVEANSPVGPASILGITAAIADVLAAIASEREGVFPVVAESVVVGRARPDIGSILREEFQENRVSGVVGHIEGHATVLCLSTSGIETDAKCEQKKENGCYFAQESSPDGE